MNEAGAHGKPTQQVHREGAQLVILKGGNRKQRSQVLPSSLPHSYPQVLADGREELGKGANPTVNQGYKCYSKFSTISQCEKVHYLIVGGSLEFSAASRDRVPRLGLLPFRGESLKEPAMGSSSEELSSKEPRIKLVISCLLICACFLSSLEGDLACWPGGLAGKDEPLVSGTFGSWSSGEGQVSLEDRGFLGGF